MQRANHIEWIANLRVLATIAVIVVHVSMNARYQDTTLYADLVYGGLARFCVPVFVMISGALLLARDISLKEYTRRWVPKIMLPFLFWSIINVLYNLWYWAHHGQYFTVGQGIKTGAAYILYGTTNFHFWYVYMIVGIYLFIPIIAKWARNATENEILYFLAIWFAAICLNLPLPEKWKTAFDLYYFTGYLGFLVLGYYLSTTRHVTLLQSLLMLLAGYGVTIGLTYYLTQKNNNFTHTYYDYLRPNIVLLSAGVFLAAKNTPLSLSRIKLLRICRDTIDKHSYGIYLVHWLVLVMLNRIHINWKLITPLAGIPLTTISCMIISFACVWLVSKLPLGRYISG